MVKPLDGVTIVALEHYVAGPFGTMLLADFGADVIRIERPGKGEPMRVPQVTSKDGQVVPIVYLINNRNKRSLTLDLKSQEGQQILRSLLKKADVLYENLSPEALKRMGLTFDVLQEINPRLIYMSVSGFGREDLGGGPLTNRPALDFIAQAMSGLMNGPNLGKEPVWLGMSLPDLATGLTAALGLVTALRERDRTGKGQRLDVSMYDVAVMMNDKGLAFYDTAGREPLAISELTNQVGIVRAKDGHAAIGVIDNDTWPKIAELIGRSDLATDPNCATLKRRAAVHSSLILPAIEAWTIQHTREEITRTFLKFGVPAGPVQNSAEVLGCPHLRQRGMTSRIDTEYGPIATMGNPIRFAGEPLPMRSPPKLGENTDDVLRELGYSETAIADLHQRNIV